MPKIKVKHIPAAARSRVCNEMYFCTKCPFYMKERVVIDEYTDIACLTDSRYDPKETVVELSEKDFPTNREWLASLSNDKLANNLVTNPIFAESSGAIEKWLSQPCESLMEEE